MSRRPAFRALRVEQQLFRQKSNSARVTADGFVAPVGMRIGPTVSAGNPGFAVTWEDTELQADLTMGNLASCVHAPESEEAALVEELRAGSEEAFAWLIAHYHQPIYSLLARTVRNRADAADLTQEVFVKVFRGIHGFPRRVVAADVDLPHSVARSVEPAPLVDAASAAGNAIEQEMTQADGRTPVRLKDMLVDPSESPYELAVHKENRARVELALRQVPEPFRTTLILRDIEGFVYEEVAAMQGVNLGNG